MHPDTLSVHAGNADDLIGSVVPPINLSTTFERDEAGTIGGRGFIYSRMDNPNRRALETKLALLEGGAEAFAFPSGNSAALAVAEAVLEPGMHLIMPDDCYHGIAAMIKPFTKPGITPNTWLVRRSLRSSGKRRSSA